MTVEEVIERHQENVLAGEREECAKLVDDTLTTIFPENNGRLVRVSTVREVLASLAARMREGARWTTEVDNVAG